MSRVLEELSSILNRNEKIDNQETIEESLKVLKSPPSDQYYGDDPQFKEFFDKILSKNLRIGFDEKNGQGKIQLKEWRELRILIFSWC